MPKPWKRKYEQKPLTDEDKIFIEFNYMTMTDEQIARSIDNRIAEVTMYRRKWRLLRKYDVSIHGGGNNIKTLDIEGFNRPSFLTLHELVKFHALLKHGATTWELCQHYNITETHCLECQVVAKLLNK